MLDKLKFSWTETNGTTHFDCPTMLWILLAKINPSVRVGISSLKTNLQNATMPMYKHDVVELLDYMHEQYTSIYQNYGNHTDYTLNLFNALETGHNDEFLSFLSKLNDEWETSSVMETDAETSENLRTKVLQKYNNMKLAKRWKKTEDKESKFISALVTEVNDLKALLTKTQPNATESKQKSTKKKDKLFVDEWRIVNKGESCTRDGATWHWCPHHKREGLYDGMYMPHKACDHDEWKRKKEERWGKKRSNPNDSTSDSSSKPTLQLTETMKQALVTEGNMTDEQATALWSKIAKN